MKVWTPKEWAAAAGYADQVGEWLAGMHRALTTINKETKADDQYIARYKTEVEKMMVEMERVIALFDDIPELPTGVIPISGNVVSIKTIQ